MSTWAYECRACAGDATWLVDRLRVDEMGPDVQVLRVRTGDEWACGVVDRRRPLAVDASLLREAVAADPAQCPECAERAEPQAPLKAPEPAAAATVATGPVAQVQAAAISLQGRRFLVVLTGLDVVRSPGEAGMLVADLKPHFGGVELVLMGQTEDGTPEYHGDAGLLQLLADLPVDRMPWRAYPIG